MCADARACPLFVGSTGAGQDTSDTGGGDDLESACIYRSADIARCRQYRRLVLSPSVFDNGNFAKRIVLSSTQVDRVVYT